MSDATLPSQRVLETTLAHAAAAAVAAGIAPPAIVAVGEVVRLRAHLDWLGSVVQKRPAASALAASSGGAESGCDSRPRPGDYGIERLG